MQKLVTQHHHPRPRRAPATATWDFITETSQGDQLIPPVVLYRLYSRFPLSEQVQLTDSSFYVRVFHSFCHFFIPTSSQAGYAGCSKVLRSRLLFPRLARHYFSNPPHSFFLFFPSEFHTMCFDSILPMVFSFSLSPNPFFPTNVPSTSMSFFTHLIKGTWARTLH